MALEKINCTYHEAYNASMEERHPFKLPEWEFTVMADPFAYLIFKGDKDKWRFITAQDRLRTDWQIVTKEFSVDGPIEQKESDAKKEYEYNIQIIKTALSIGVRTYPSNQTTIVKPTRVPHQFKILNLKEKFGFKYVSLYDGYVLNINKDWKIFFRNNEFQLNCVENKIGDVEHSKSLGLNIASIEDLEAAIKLLNLQPQ